MLTTFPAVTRTLPALVGLLGVIVPCAGAAQTSSNIELANSQAFTRIGALTAHGLNFTGRGVTIAVLDTGINAANPDLAGRILPGRNFTASNPATVADALGHGTHVAGLIAANRNGVGMFGVAYEAQVMPVKVIGDNGVGNTTWINNGLRWAADQKAQIANMSIMSTAAFDPAAMKYAVGKGMLLVAGAGNSGLPNPAYPARYASQPWAGGQVINVVAVDANNVITAWSNRAGDAMNFTLAAPGVNLMSTVGTGYGFKSGTSMSTPVVSGAAALVKSRWTYLSARDVANILFVTATDLGARGVDPIYGRGLVNVDQAMKPVGQVSTVNYSGKPIPLFGAATGGAVAGALQSAAQAGLLVVSGFDSFGRDFATNLGNSVFKAPPMPTDEMFGLVPLAPPARSVGLSVAQGNALTALPVPHLGLMANALSVSARLQLTGGWSMAPALAAQPDKAMAASLGVSRRVGRDGEIGFALSQMSEQQTFLGAATQGALGLGHSSTTALAFFGQAALDDQTTLDASMSVGSTPATQGNLLSTTSAISQAFRMSVSRRDALRENDRAAIVLEQPMRLTGGTLAIDRMVGTDESGAPVMERGSVSLKPSGREWRLSLHYAMPLGRDSSLQLVAMHRSQPGHFADAAPERAAALRYRAAF